MNESISTSADFLRRELFGWNPGVRESLSTQFVESALRDVHVQRECRYCHEIVSESEFATTRTYWQPNVLYPCHKQCKADGEKREAYECQVIDADCNDCKHFKRGAANGRGIWNGECLKLGRPTKAHAVFSSNYPCFEHRKQRA